MSFWNWALAAYERPGVPQACLTLQDDHGQNTSFLLWAIWSGCEDPALLEQAADLARRWDAVALHPIRAARRGLKASLPPMADSVREAFRGQVKAAELEAEKVLMETLAGFAGSLEGATYPGDLKAAVKAWGGPAPDAALAALIQALA